MRFYGVYLGTVTAVYDPTDSKNISKYQYEYSVSVTIDGFAQMPVNNCIQADKDGSVDNYEHQLLLPASLVLVTFPNNGDPSGGVIIGAIRSAKDKQKTVSGSKQQWLKRYNKFDLGVDQDETFKIQHDTGPKLEITKTKVTISDRDGEEIIIDKATKTLTLKAKTWKVEVTQNASIEVKGNATIEAKQIKLGKSAAEAVVKGDTFKQIFNGHQHLGNLGAPTGPPIMPMTDDALSKKVKTE